MRKRLFSCYIAAALCLATSNMSLAAPQGAAKALLEANEEMRAGHYALAARQYESWLKANGDTKDVLFALAVCDLQLGKNHDAVPLLERNLKLDPNSAASHAALGIALMDGANATAARGHLQTALKLNPTQADAAEALARIDLMEGNPAGAISVLRPIADSANTTETQILLMGEALLAENKPQEASALLEKRLAQDPLSGAGVYSLATRAAMQSGDLARTAEIGEKGTRYYPDSDVARAYLSLPAPYLAERIGKRIERLQEQPDAYEMVALGRILIDADPTHQTRANDIAIRLLRSAISQAPEYASAYFNLGRALALTNSDQALEQWQKALSLKADDDLRLQIYTQVGVAYTEKSQFDLAEKAYSGALEINRRLPQHRPDSALQFVRFLRVRGRQPEAESLLEQVLNWNPMYPQAHLERATLAAAENRWPQVVEDGEFVLRNSGKDEDLQRSAHFLLMRAYRGTGEPQKAAPHAQWLKAH